MRAHAKQLLDDLLGAAPMAASAAKRWRLRCLQPLVLMLLGPHPPDLGAADDDTGGAYNESGIIHC